MFRENVGMYLCPEETGGGDNQTNNEVRPVEGANPAEAKATGHDPHPDILATQLTRVKISGIELIQDGGKTIGLVSGLPPFWNDIEKVNKLDNRFALPRKEGDEYGVHLAVGISKSSGGGTLVLGGDNPGFYNSAYECAIFVENGETLGLVDGSEMTLYSVDDTNAWLNYYKRQFAEHQFKVEAVISQELEEWIKHINYSNATWGIHWGTKVSEQKILGPDTAVVLAKSSEWSDDGGGVAKTDKVLVYHQGQKRRIEFPWRDQSDPRKDRPEIAVGSLGKIEVGEREDATVFKVELINSRGSRFVDFTFKQNLDPKGE